MTERDASRLQPSGGRISGTVIQALRHLGGKQIGGQHIMHLRQTLSASDKAQLKRDRIYSPGWMHRIIDAIAEDSRA